MKSFIKLSDIKWYMYISMTSCFGLNQWSSSCAEVITVCVGCSLFRFIGKKASGRKKAPAQPSLVITAPCN